MIYIVTPWAFNGCEALESCALFDEALETAGASRAVGCAERVVTP
jgi:hypothetical protein